MDRLGMKAHHAAILLLAQEFEHAGLIVGSDQHLGEEFVDRARELQVPRPIRDDDPAEGRVGIGRESLVPGGLQRVGRRPRRTACCA